MKVFMLLGAAVALLATFSSATHGLRNLMLKHTVSSPFSGPFPPFPPPHSTSVQYNIRVNPMKFGPGPPPGSIPLVPAYAVPIAMPHAASFPMPHPAAAFPMPHAKSGYPGPHAASPFPGPHALAAYQTIPVFLSPHYAAAPAHSLMDKGLAHGPHY